MLGLDTNVLVRFLVRDHEAQFERARRLIKREVGAPEKVLISLLVLLETEWVLRSRYGLRKNQIMEINGTTVIQGRAARLSDGRQRIR